MKARITSKEAPAWRDVERHSNAVFDAAPVAIFQCDRDCRVMLANRAAAALFGADANDLSGKPLALLFGEEAFGSLRPHFDAVLSGASADRECELALGNGRSYHLRFAPMRSANGHATSVDAVLAVVCDITDLRKTQSEHEHLLARERAARIQAETAARARDEFLAIVSHELRAPLNGIQSWAHILENYVQEAVSAPLAQRALSGIKTGVAQQVRLIEDLLDATRMMSGRLRLVKQPVMLLPIIQAATESVRAAAQAKNIEIRSALNITAEQIDGDPDRVQQIIWNLLCNAIKFTPDDGHIWLSAHCEDGHICVAVRDDGIGIAPDFLPYLFDRFSQKDTSSTRGHSGLGLGLFLVHRLVELHGGSIKAESAGEGKGSSFSLLLPLRAYRSPYLPAAHIEGDEARSQLPSLKGLRLLLIDDQEEVRESLAIMLSSAGADVFAASASQEVLEWLPTASAKELPDILICDIAMPVEDGYTVLRKLRSWSQEGGPPPLQHMPALALTAFAQREDRIKALTAGFQMHLTKPVAPEELIIVIAMLAVRR